MNELLALIAAGVVALWGVAHAVNTGPVVAGFEPLSRDNRWVITQEWAGEAFAMWGIAAFIVIATLVGGAGGSAVRAVYFTAAGVLLAFAALTLLTGARTRVIWFRVCVVLLTVSAIRLMVAGL